MSEQNLTRQSAELYDIYAPIPIDAPSSTLFITGGAVLCAIIILTLIFLFIRRKKETNRPYWQKTLQQIDTLRPLQNSESPLYIEKIDTLLRHYIANRFALHSTSQTTSEFFHSKELQNNSELQGFHKELRSLFDQADMIKFAHLPPTREQLTEIEDAVRLFIRQTAPTCEESKIKGERL